MFKDKGKYFLIEEFKKYGVSAIFTKKNCGNMADYIGENGLKNRQKLLKSLGLENKKIVHALQKHTNRVECIENLDNLDNLENIDGFITKSKDFVIFTYYADCLPIFILDKKQKAFGVAHSGWVGTYNEIIINLIDKMLDVFNSNLEDLIIALGIGISQEDYEVGEEFYKNFLNKFGECVNSSFKFEKGKIYFDNTKLNAEFAKKRGIKQIIIDDRGVKKAYAFSHRLDKENVGRSAAIITVGD